MPTFQGKKKAWCQLIGKLLPAKVDRLLPQHLRFSPSTPWQRALQVRHSLAQLSRQLFLQELGT